MINEKIINSKILLFTGAGASKPLGKWLMDEFIFHLLKQLESEDNLHKLLQTLIKHRKMDLEEILKEIEEILEKEYFAENEPNYIIQSLEDDNVVKHSKNSLGTKRAFFPESDKISPGEQYRLPFSSRFQNLIFNCKKLKTKIEVLLFEHYWEMKDKQVSQLYSPLLELLKGYVGENNTLPIFTSNYDVSIEKYASLADTRFVDGFESKTAGIRIWNQKIFDEFQPDRNKLNIVLFKLHGSLSWYKEEGNIKSVPLAIHRPEEARERNVLVYPAKKKITLEEPFFTCYDYFQRCLDHAKIAIFIGYSFRDYDTITKIKSALSYNSKIKIFILDPNATMLFDEIFPSFKSRFQTFPEEFSEDTAKYLVSIDLGIKKIMGPRIRKSTFSKIKTKRDQ